jgi:hypothetical protein
MTKMSSMEEYQQTQQHNFPVALTVSIGDDLRAIRACADGSFLTSGNRYSLKFTLHDARYLQAFVL